MADDAVTNAVDELINELETVREALLMKQDGSDCNVEVVYNVIQSVRAVTEFVHKQNEDHQEPPTESEYECQVTGELIKFPVKSGQTSEQKIPPQRKLVYLLSCLPFSNASGDTILMKEILLLTKSPYIQVIFGRIKGAIIKLLNPTSIQRSHSDASLQRDLVNIVRRISVHDYNKTRIVEDCPGAVPFLMACLKSRSTETKRLAVAALDELSRVGQIPNRMKIVESGAIKALAELIEEGDLVGLTHAAKAILYLCRVAANRERAVSEGAVIAVMGKIIGRILVDQMLETLEMLSIHEKAIQQLEENGMVRYLFMRLREEDVTDKSKEYCVTIVHTMCRDDVTKTRKLINGVVNARDTLGHVVSSGTTKAREKASELLSKLDSADDLVP